MGQILAIIIALIAVGLSIFSWHNVRELRRQMENALKASDGHSLEDTLVTYHAHITDVDNRLAELEDSYAKLTVMTSVASQKISVVRYNPFGDTGGDQSFSLAVLDGHDCGYVLTSIHGRQGTRVYIKPIDFGKSKHSLSDEETQAMHQAISRLPQLPNAKE